MPRLDTRDFDPAQEATLRIGFGMKDAPSLMLLADHASLLAIEGERVQTQLHGA